MTDKGDVVASHGENQFLELDGLERFVESGQFRLQLSGEVIETPFDGLGIRPAAYRAHFCRLVGFAFCIDGCRARSASDGSATSRSQSAFSLGGRREQAIVEIGHPDRH